MKAQTLSELTEVMWHAVEQSPSIVVIADADQNIEYVNPEFCRLTDHMFEELNGKNILAMHENVLSPAAITAIRGNLMTGRPWSGELQARKKNGDLYWEFATISAVRNPNGSIEHYLKVAEDITSTKATALELKESQQRYERIVTAMRGFMFTVHLRDGRPIGTTYYPGSAQVTGYTVEEYQADSMLWFNMIVEEDREAVTRQIETIRYNHGIQSVEHRIRHKNGSIRWVKNFSVPTLDAAGTMVAYDGLITDISELKQTEFHRDKLLGELRHMAVRDALTGLFSRRGMEEELNRAWQLGNRHNQTTGVLVLDIDHFKVINDTYGHHVGDMMLIEFAELVSTTVRMADIVCRYGGDEIVVILPLTDRDKSLQIAERLRTACEHHVFCQGTHDLHSTASVGVSCNHGDPEDAPQRTLTNADHALFRAKQLGRNQTCLWESDSAIPLDRVAPDFAENGTAATPSPGKGHILVVDDEESIRHLMQTLLQQAGYQVLTAENAAEASLLAGKFKGMIDVALIDLALGQTNGLEVLQQLRQLDETVVGIIVTGQATIDAAADAMRYGASDFITKPVVLDHLIMAVDRGIRYHHLLRDNQNYQRHLENMVAERSASLSRALGQVKQSYRGTLEVLANMLETRENKTGEHSKRVAAMTKILAAEMGLSPNDIDTLYHGALMHDIGKIIVPDAILLKQGALTESEWKIIRLHPQIGYEIVRACPAMEQVSEIVYSHQERYDGSGYPRGLQGDHICLGARVFAVIDSYDAIRSDRPYSHGKNVEEAIGQIIAGRGTQYDPAVVDAFERCQPRIEACLS